MSNAGWPTQPGVAPPPGFTSEMLQRSHPAYPGHPDHEAWLESVDAELAVAVHEFHGFETPDEATVGEWDASTVGGIYTGNGAHVVLPVEPGPTAEEIAEAERAEAEALAAEEREREERAAAEDAKAKADGHPATEESKPPKATPKATPTKKAAAKRGARRGR